MKNERARGGTEFGFLVSAKDMNQPFSGALLSVVLTLFFSIIVSTPMFRCGLRPLELPITSNPDNFGEFVKEDSIWIKYDGTRYYEWDWITDYSERATEIQKASRVVLNADASLNFGLVRQTLAELSKLRRDGIILSSEQEYVETKPSPFENYLARKSISCGCVW